MDTLKQLSRFIRWRDWGPGKLTILWCLSLYIAVAYDIPFSTYVLTFLVFLIFAATQSALGYVLNDWGDRELDRRQFKFNAFNGLSQLERILVLTLILIAALIAGLPLIARPGFALLWLAWAASAASYSLEPIRLKTKGAVGLIVSFVAQWFLPVLITFAAFQVAGGLDMWLFALGLTISGGALEIAHQRYDRTRDMLTRAQTFAARLPDSKVDRIYAGALLLDKLAIGMLVIVIVTQLAKIQTWWSTSLAGALAVVYIVLLVATLGNNLRGIFGGSVDDPYYNSGKRTLASALHQTLFNFIVPVMLGIAAMTRAPLYAFVLGLFLVWRVVLGGADWLWPLKAIRIRLSK